MLLRYYTGLNDEKNNVIAFLVEQTIYQIMEEGEYNQLDIVNLLFDNYGNPLDFINNFSSMEEYVNARIEIIKMYNEYIAWGDEYLHSYVELNYHVDVYPENGCVMIKGIK